MARLHFK